MSTTDTGHWRQTQLSGISFPRLQQAERVWQSWRGDCFAPVFRSDFFLEIPALAPMGVVVDTNTEGPPFQFRYFGSELARMHTFELTGKDTNAIEPEGFRELCVGQYQAVLDERRPISFLNDIPTLKDDVTAKHIVLRMPFSEDGTSVTQVVSVEEIDLHPEDMRDIFQAHLDMSD